MSAAGNLVSGRSAAFVTLETRAGESADTHTHTHTRKAQDASTLQGQPLFRFLLQKCPKVPKSENALSSQMSVLSTSSQNVFAKDQNKANRKKKQMVADYQSNVHSKKTCT